MIPLFFCKAFDDQMVYLSCVLMWFKVILGLKINLDKSELIKVGRLDNEEELAFNLEVGEVPTTYLGLPLSNGMEWKSGFKRGFLCGKGNNFLKGGGLF